MKIEVTPREQEIRARHERDKLEGAHNFTIHDEWCTKDRAYLLTLIDQLRGELKRKTKALEHVLAEPYGCPFCDSGKLRNPCKSHDANCGFELARAALTGGEG